MAKVSKKEAEEIYEEVSSQPLYSPSKAYQVQTIEQCRLETIKKMTELTDIAVDTLVTIMSDSDAKQSDRLRAATKVLEYAIGRPREANFVDDAAFNRNNNASRIIIEGNISPDAVRDAIGANFYGEGDKDG